MSSLPTLCHNLNTCSELVLFPYFPGLVNGPGLLVIKSAPRGSFLDLSSALIALLYILYCIALPSYTAIPAPFSSFSLQHCIEGIAVSYSGTIMSSNGPAVSVLSPSDKPSNGDLILSPKAGGWLIFFQVKAFCTVFKSFHNPTPANNHHVISFYPSWKSFLGLPSALVSQVTLQCFVSGGNVRRSPLPSSFFIDLSAVFQFI